MSGTNITTSQTLVSSLLDSKIRFGRLIPVADPLFKWLCFTPLHRLFFLIIVAEGNLARAGLGCHICRCIFFKSFLYSMHVGLEQLVLHCVWRFSLQVIGALIFVSSQGRNLVLEVRVKESTFTSPSSSGRSWSCSLGAYNAGLSAL